MAYTDRMYNYSFFCIFIHFVVWMEFGAFNLRDFLNGELLIE